MQSTSDTLVEDVPLYQHTMWIMAKVRKTAPNWNIDNADYEAVEDVSDWEILEFDTGICHSKEIVRVK